MQFEMSNLDGIGIWVTVREGGLVPEAFTYSITNAAIAYENEVSIGGFTKLNLLLIPTSSNAVPMLTINDGGTYWTNQTYESLGPDISARFEAVNIESVELVGHLRMAWS